MADSKETNVRGLIAEFDAVEPLKKAATRIRDAGYTKIDAFTPFPVHGLEKCLGIPPTALPWIALIAGATGTSLGLLMEIWMNGYDYKYIISGKPFISLPAFIPVAYELTILLASFGSFFGMLALNGLPKFSNPLFNDPKFDRATDDRFFLLIDSSDPRFQEAGVRKLFGELHPLSISEVREDDSPKAIPRWILTVVAILGLVALIPPLIGARMRVTNSEKPRFHVFFEMDFQPKKLAQQTSTLFADGRVMREPVSGTVARGQYVADPSFSTGIDIGATAAINPQHAERLVAWAYAQDAGQAPAAGDQPPADAPKPDDAPKGDEPAKPADAPAADTPAQPPADAPKPDAPKPDAPAADAGAKPADAAAAAPAAPAAQDAPVGPPIPYLKKIPMEVNEQLLARGQQKFEIYCAVCHGLDGSGNGLVNQRARANPSESPNWVPPSSFHQEPLYKQDDGQIFVTITQGVRKMPGYASQINAADRWAIVAYVRALQRARNAKLEDIPVEKRGVQ